MIILELEVITGQCCTNRTSGPAAILKDVWLFYRARYRDFKQLYRKFEFNSPDIYISIYNIIINLLYEEKKPRDM